MRVCEVAENVCAASLRAAVESCYLAWNPVSVSFVG